MRILIVIILLSGCTYPRVNIGIAVHSNYIDSPEHNETNPLGVIRVEGDTKINNATYFCEHISSISDNEKGSGLNMCGLQLKVF